MHLFYVLTLMYISALEVVYTLCVDEAAQQAQLSWSVWGNVSALKCAKASVNCPANYFKRITVAESG